MKKIILLVLISVILVSCNEADPVENVVYTDVDGNVYQTTNVNGTVWTTVDLETISDLDGNDLTSYPVEGRESRLYTINMIDHMISEGWRLPTSKDWETLMSEYDTVEKLRESDFNLSFSGMYDFTDVYQWVDTGCLYLAKDGEKLSYYFYDGQGEQLKTGNFHPKDAFSIRLVKIKMPK